MLDLVPKTLIGIVGAVFLFGFAVFVHELGHFLTAKWFGVGVKKFAIGFGPKIWAFVWRGTEYSLRWIPVGGFVMLKGMIEGLDEPGATPDGKPPEDKADDSSPGLEKDLERARKAAGGKITEDLDALRNRHFLVRIAVFASGVTCNFLTAIVLIGFISWRGVPIPEPLPNRIYAVPADSRLYDLGWRSGDRIVEVGDAPTNTWEDVWAAMGAKIADDRPATLTLTVSRDDRRIDLPFPTTLSETDLAFFEPPRPAIVGGVMPRSGAATARLYKDNYSPGEAIRPVPTWGDMRKTPLHPQDRIVEIESAPIENWQEMDREIRKRPNQAILFAVERESDGKKRLLRLATVLETAAGRPSVGRLGIISGRRLTGARESEPFLASFAQAPVRAFAMSAFLVRKNVEFIAEMGWRETKRGLGGPLKIGQMAYQSAKSGLDEYLNLFVVISLILAILNILPIPVLDGGYILIAVVEALIRRPIPERILVPVLTSFMLFFITAIGWLFVNDIINW